MTHLKETGPDHGPPKKKQAEAKPDRRPPGAPRTGPPLTDVLPYIQRH